MRGVFPILWPGKGKVLQEEESWVLRICTSSSSGRSKNTFVTPLIAPSAKCRKILSAPPLPSVEGAVKGRYEVVLQRRDACLRNIWSKDAVPIFRT